VAGLQQQPYVVHPCFDVTRLPFHFLGVGLSPAPPAAPATPWATRP
jgi:hypothetical protein